MITVTPMAIDKIKGILEEEKAPGSALRILMIPSGHGVQYMFSLESETKEDDVAVDADGVRILIDPDTAPLLQGSSIDYVESLMRSGFVIQNPNIQPSGEGCACGGQCSCGGH
ncbi:MAG: iron-sulfur cluster assembly accessory protein [Chloroflexi bacterium]|nr:iron-sulfur cluster assembly accessory protein [Chloroflexota bacterium]